VARTHSEGAHADARRKIVGLATKIRDAEERERRRGFSTSAGIIEDSCGATGHGTTK